MCKHIYIYFPLSIQRCGRGVWKEEGKEKKGEVERVRATVGTTRSQELQPVRMIECY